MLNNFWNKYARQNSGCLESNAGFESGAKGNMTNMAFNNVQHVCVTLKYISRQTRAEERGRSFVSGP